MTPEGRLLYMKFIAMTFHVGKIGLVVLYKHMQENGSIYNHMKGTINVKHAELPAIFNHGICHISAIRCHGTRHISFCSLYPMWQTGII